MLYEKELFDSCFCFGFITSEDTLLLLFSPAFTCVVSCYTLHRIIICGAFQLINMFTLKENIILKSFLK